MRILLRPISNALLAEAGYNFRHKGMVYFLGHWGMGDTERTTTQHVSNSVQQQQKQNSFNVFNVSSSQQSQQQQHHLSVRNAEYVSEVQLQQQLQRRQSQLHYHQQQQQQQKQFGTDSSARISGFCLTKSANVDLPPYLEDQQQQQSEQLNNCHIDCGSIVSNTHLHSHLHSNHRNSSGSSVGSVQCCSQELNFNHHHLHQHQYHHHHQQPQQHQQQSQSYQRQHHQQTQQQQQHDTESDEDEIALYPLNNQVSLSQY